MSPGLRVVSARGTAAALAEEPRAMIEHDDSSPRPRASVASLYSTEAPAGFSASPVPLLDKRVWDVEASDLIHPVCCSSSSSEMFYQYIY